MIEVTPITAITYTIIATVVLREHHVMTYAYRRTKPRTVACSIKQVSPGRCVRREVYAFELGVELGFQYYISYSRTFLSILNAICPVHRLSTIFRTQGRSYPFSMLSALCTDTVLHFVLKDVPIHSQRYLPCAQIKYYISYSRMFLLSLYTGWVGKPLTLLLNRAIEEITVLTMGRFVSILQTRKEVMLHAPLSFLFQVSPRSFFLL